MKAYLLTVLRMFKSNLSRFLAIIGIVALGIAVISGIGGTSAALRSSGDAYLKECNVSDLDVKSQNAAGFTNEELSALSASSVVAHAIPFTVYDFTLNGVLTRIYFLPLSDMDINRMTLLEGKYPEADTDILVERSKGATALMGIGDTLSLDILTYHATLTVTGIASHPLHYAKSNDPSFLDQNEEIENIIYLDSALFSPPTVTDVYLQIKGADAYNIFSKDYQSFLSDSITVIAAETGGDYVYLTHQEIYSSALLELNANRVNRISLILPAFFIAVVALVVLTTMTRLAEEERTLIGCVKTLGYWNLQILLKYVLFALIGCILGSVIGLLVGLHIILPVIYNAYEVIFHLFDFVNTGAILFGLISALILGVVVLSVTVYVVGMILRENPADLLRHKAPRAGRKVFLEKIPFLWNKLKFRYKSSLRNIFRYKGRFFMTVLSVMGSTTLILAGFALYDAANSASSVYGVLGQSAESLMMISGVVVLCAALLSVLVIYNLTNINIEERRREIATLKVLGYRNSEVSGYVFREVFILCLIGIALGIPAGCLLIHIVFTYIEFGTIAQVQWPSYILTVVLSLLFVFIVDLLLAKKITKIDMNTSLKTIE